MFGGRLCCLSYIFVHSALLLLYDVEASSCDRVIHKKVGDTVELPSCLPTEGVTSASWKYKDTIIVEKDIGTITYAQFMDRVDINSTNFSLTVRKLTPQDSGVFSLISEVNDKQSPTVVITLQVHEPITEQPILTINSTWNVLSEACTVVLECSAASDRNVSYNWTVRNETHSGSRLQKNIQPKDGDIKFTCTIFNFVSENSASKTVKCSNNTSTDQPKQGNGRFLIVLILSVAAGSCLIVVGIAVGVCYYKKRRTETVFLPPDTDLNELTVYADICDVATEDRTSTTIKPCSVYETIDKRVKTVKPEPQTVYDKIQFNRVRNPSVSPYQDIS